MDPPVSIDDVCRAQARLAGVAVQTPLIRCADLEQRCRGRLFLKLESLQHTGSFKFRGAYNRLVQLTDEQRVAGVVAFSSGNHAQGIAYAAQLLHIPATIVMPSDAPAIKIANTRAFGAEIIFYDRQTESRETIGARLAGERGAVLVPSFDDPHIIAGQGVCGLEIAERMGALGEVPQAALICTGGGGLISGSALALKHHFPQVEIFAVEPAGFDDTTRSLAAGERLRNNPGAHSFCDALLAPEPGELTFAINRDVLSGGLVVTDAEVARAVAYAFRYLKIVLEPGGAVALAAVLADKAPLAGRTTVVVCSGGNIDTATFERCLGEWPEP